MKILVTALMGLLLAGPASAAPERYDGHWWFDQTEDQRATFIIGQNDCTYYDLKRLNVFQGSMNGWSGAVTAWYESHPDALSERVLFVSHRPLPPQEGWKHLEGGEAGYPGKHGMYDGDYYYQLGDLRAYFVMGYLDCRATYFRDVLLHPVEYYVRQLDDWFGISTDGQSAHHEHKIGTVLDSILRSEKAVTEQDISKQ